MIVCTQCGFQNVNTDTFCGSCGGFLEWTGEVVTPPVVELTPDELAPKRGLRERIQTALSLDVYAPGEVVKGEPAAAAPGGAPGAARPGGPPGASGPPGSGGPPRPPGAPPQPPISVPDDPAIVESPDQRDAHVAAALVARNATAPPIAPAVPRPVARTTVTRGETTIGAAEPSATAVQPGAVSPVKPMAPAQRSRPVKQPPSRTIVPGDLVCGECGEGNPPARNFCSRCGNTLKDAAVAKRKWWQRLVPRRRRKSMEAGARPWKASNGGKKQRRKGGKLGKLFAKLRPIIAGAMLLVGLVVGVTPNLREKATGKIGDVKDSIMSKVQPHYVPLAPITITGTSEQPDSPVSAVIDGNTITSWIAQGEDLEPTIVVRFDEPFDLERLKLWNGAAVGFKDHDRVSQIHFVFDTGQSFDLTVNDLPDPQEYEIKNAKGVQEIELHIVETYSSLSGDAVGLSEIEFLFRK